MHMYGFGIPGQGFHSLKLPGLTKRKVTEFVGLIQIKSEIASAERLEEELQHLIGKSWQWKVKQFSDSDYLAAFPNKQILDTFSRSKGIELALYNILATVSHSNLDLVASLVLQNGWVLLYNVPDPAKNVEAITLIAELVGEVLVVDEVSLIKNGPVRVKLQARDISKLSGFVDIFIEGVGYEIKCVPENYPKKPSSNIPPPPKKLDDEDYQDEEEDDLCDTDEEPPKRNPNPNNSRNTSKNPREGGSGGKQKGYADRWGVHIRDQGQSFGRESGCHIPDTYRGYRSIQHWNFSGTAANTVSGRGAHIGGD